MKKILSIVLLLLIAVMAVHATGPWTRLIGQNLTAYNAPSPYAVWTNATAFNSNCDVWRSFDNNSFGGAACGSAGQGDVVLNEKPGIWITIDLGSGNATVMDSFNLTFANYNSTRQYDPVQFQMFGSNDNSSYANLGFAGYGGTNTTNAAGRTIQLNFTNAVAYRYYRWQFWSNAGNNNTFQQYSEIMPLRGTVAVPANTYLTISVNDTRQVITIASYTYTYNTTNGSDPGPFTRVVTNTSWPLTNYTGTLTINFTNISSNTYFNTSLQNYAFTGAANATALTWQNYLNVSINNTVNGSSIGHFNFSVTNGTASTNASTTSGSIIFYNLIGPLTLLWSEIDNQPTPTTNHAYCYQETANISTPCGGLNNGSYSIAHTGGGSISNGPYGYDGNYTTSTGSSAFGGISFYSTYTVPASANVSNSSWQVKAGDQFVNYTLSSCPTTGGILQFRIDSSSGIGEITAIVCYNSTTSVTFNGSQVLGASIYEEAMFWDMPAVIAGGYQYFNVSQSITGFNTTLNLTNFSHQALLSVSPYQLYTSSLLSNFNVTNNLASNKTGGTNYLVPANNGSNNIQVDVGGNYSQNYTCTVTVPLSTTVCSATGIYDDRFTIGASNNGASVSSFRIASQNNTLGGVIFNQSTTNHSLVLPLLQGYTYLMMLSNSGFALQNASLPANASTNLYNFTLFTRNTLNLTFYDEQNGSTVNGNGTPGNGPTITVELISAAQSFNSTTNNGTLLISNLLSGSYIIRYIATNYVLKLYQFTLINDTYTALSLSMLRSASATSITVTVVDQAANTQSNLTVKVLRYNVVTNTYSIVEIFNTDSEGVGVFDASLNSEFYYFIVQDLTGNILLQTSPSLLYSNTIQLVIGNTITGMNNLFSDANLTGVITYNTTTDVARFVYIDSDNVASKGCLYTYQLTASNKILYNSSCVSSASSTLTSPITNTSGSYWLFQGVVTKGGVDYLVSTFSKSFQDTFAQEARNKIGLFMLFIIELLIIAIFRYSIRLMVFISSIMPMLFSLAGFIPFGLGYTAPIFIIGIIITYILGT